MFMPIDAIVGKLITYKSRHSKDIRFQKVLNGDINHDIIIIGSSRAARNILANQISTDLKTSAYNLGYPGSNIEWHKFLLETLLEFNNKPRLIILTLDYGYNFITNPSLAFRYDILQNNLNSPYATQKLIIDGKKHYDNNNILRLTKGTLNSLIYLPGYFTRKSSFRDSINLQGSMPLYGKKKSLFFDDGLNKRLSNWALKNENYRYLKDFEEIQRICFELGIELLVTIPPNYNISNVDYCEYLEDKIKYPNISLTDCSSSIFEKNTDVYYDLSHLNIQGAQLYTKSLYPQILSKIKK